MINYEYNIYKNKHLSLIDMMLLECCFVWNHALELQKRYNKCSPNIWNTYEHL